jgi:hypothetical protein
MKALLFALFLFLLLSGCIEQEVSIRDLRADIPEMIIDSTGGTTSPDLNVYIYIMGVEKYRYPRTELYVNGERVAVEEQSLVLKYTYTLDDEAELKAVAITQSANYSHSCRISLESEGIKIYDKSERLIRWKDMPYEIVMEAEL